MCVKHEGTRNGDRGRAMNRRLYFAVKLISVDIQGFENRILTIMFLKPPTLTRKSSTVSPASINKEKSQKSPKSKGNGGKSIDITVTQTSGKLGVLMWLNAYLELEGKEPVSENHAAVEAIH